jgi:hypothetical protein
MKFCINAQDEIHAAPQVMSALKEIKLKASLKAE